MSGLSVVDHFPWRRVKVAYQSVSSEPASALVRLEPERAVPSGLPRLWGPGAAGPLPGSEVRS